MAHKTLKTALLSNALFSTISGVTFLLLGQSVSTIVGVGAPLIYQIVGVGLLAFAGYVGWVATRTPINTYEALQISAADLLWVVGTVVLIGMMYGSISNTGIVTLLVIAGIVLIFALWQYNGISDFYAAPNKKGTHRICVAIDTPEPADKMWSIVADMKNIDSYSPHLTEVVLRNGAEPGVGTVRQCTDDKGKVWAEKCTNFDHQARKLDVRFLADEPGFPFPFRTMNGGWEVVPTANGSTVNLWFEVTAKNRWLHPMILGILSKDMARNFGDVVARMAASARGEAVHREEAAPTQGIAYTLIPC